MRLGCSWCGKNQNEIKAQVEAQQERGLGEFAKGELGSAAFQVLIAPPRPPRKHHDGENSISEQRRNSENVLSDENGEDREGVRYETSSHAWLLAMMDDDEIGGEPQRRRRRRQKPRKQQQNQLRGHNDDADGSCDGDGGSTGLGVSIQKRGSSAITSRDDSSMSSVSSSPCKNRDESLPAAKESSIPRPGPQLRSRTKPLRSSKENDVDSYDDDGDDDDSPSVENSGERRTRGGANGGRGDGGRDRGGRETKALIVPETQRQRGRTAGTTTAKVSSRKAVAVVARLLVKWVPLPTRIVIVVCTGEEQ